jgi:excinuclease UvrABC helicase subunit UvrB
LYNETSKIYNVWEFNFYEKIDDFEMKLNSKVSNVLKELNSDLMIPENSPKGESDSVLEENKNVDLEMVQEKEKTIEEYDRQISEAVKKEHPEIFMSNFLNNF